MKLNNGFVMYESGEDHALVGIGEGFKGMVKMNSSAAAILKMLSEGSVTRETLISRMLEIYDAPADLVAKDVDSVIEKLRELGAIDD